MRKKVLLFILAVTLFLSSCSTSVSVSYNRPSEINMGRYRNIAVASTVPFKGFRSPGFYVRAVDDAAAFGAHVRSSYDEELASEVASYATASLVSSLSSTGFFNIISSSAADDMISRSRMGFSIRDDIDCYGVDAFIIPRIVSMDINEYLSSERFYHYDYSRVDQDGNPVRIADYRYYLTQSASIVYSYTVIDAGTMTVYASKNFSDKVENTTEVTSFGFSTPDPASYFRLMVDNITAAAAFQLAPSRADADMKLMDNKPENKKSEAAYDHVKDGDLHSALQIFLSVWDADAHLPSGYNCALLLAACGDIPAAVDLLHEVQTLYGGNSDLSDLLAALEEMNRNNEAAQSQMDGSAPYINYADSSTSIFALVMGE